MKNIYLLVLLIIAVGCNNPKSTENEPESVASNREPVSLEELIGAWETTIETDSGNIIQLTAILTDGYLSAAGYSVDDKVFYFTSGSKWELEEGKMVSTYEFDTRDSSLVGKTEKKSFTLKNDTLLFEEDNITWIRLDDGSPGDLQGAWLITGRQRDGEISRRTPGPRKTMKILSGTRFQWIAYNTETKAFMGTGGGTYTTVDGKYTEKIEFFSRDSSRVGASLEFDYSLKDGEWHHSGFSSKGDPLYEIWSLRE